MAFEVVSRVFSTMGALVAKVIGLSGSIPKPTGKYSRICVLKGRPEPGMCLTQAFFPAEEVEGSSTKPGKASHVYVREEAAEGLGQWLKLGYLTRVLVAGMKHNVDHPFTQGDRLHKDFSKPGSLPVVIFSHGLGGSCELYSKICCDIASHGYLVLALEHADGSASFAQHAETAEVILYRAPPDGMAYERELVKAFRAPFLEHRKAEVKRVVSFLCKHMGNEATPLGEDQVNLQAKTSSPDRPAALETFESLVRNGDCHRVFLGGHSFGACSSVHISRDPSVGRFLKRVFLLDLWPFPLDDEHLQQGMNHDSINILSQQFIEYPEVEYTKTLVANTMKAGHHRAHLTHIPGSMHQQFSDVPYFLSKRAAKRAYALGDTDVEDSQPALMEAILEFFRSGQLVEHELLHTVPVEVASADSKPEAAAKADIKAELKAELNADTNAEPIIEQTAVATA
mmetsp:Transcript_20486/g.36451  ORF Transcript_20486/g.36451 Transcript_20486/m.36451 type:complete len:454 (-) Transcript_20486:104-1465(-)